MSSRLARSGTLSLLVLSLIALPARAQTSVPGPTAPPVTASTFGGCNWSGRICFQPSLIITPLAINLSKNLIEGSFKPGIGYGFTWQPGQWYSLGADIYGNVDPAAQIASLSIMAKLVNGYLRIGVSKDFIGSHDWRIPIAFGVDL